MHLSRTAERLIFLEWFVRLSNLGGHNAWCSSVCALYSSPKCAQDPHNTAVAGRGLFLLVALCACRAAGRRICGRFPARVEDQVDQSPSPGGGGGRALRAAHGQVRQGKVSGCSGDYRGRRIRPNQWGQVRTSGDTYGGHPLVDGVASSDGKTSGTWENE